MKRLLVSVLTLLLLASFLTVPALAATEAARGKYYGIDWRFDDQTDTLILSGTGDMPEPQEKFPWYNKYPWFKVRSLAKHLVIQEGITEIGREAFLDFTELEDVSLPQSLFGIGVGAFSGCTSLRSIELPGSLQRIGYCAFENCTSLKSVTFSEGLRVIGGYGFSDCEKLEKLVLPKSLEELEERAFEDCTSLTRVDFHWGLHMNPYAFDGCGELPEVTRYLLFTRGTPLLVGLLVLLFALAWSVSSLYRTDKTAFCRNLANRFLIVAGAVALGWLLGLLWDKLELNKRAGDYGIILYMLAGLVPEPFRETAVEWADNTYLLIYTLTVLLSVAVYQFYVGRCWIRVLGKPGWVLVPAVALSAAKILVDTCLSHYDYWLRALKWKDSPTELFIYIIENGGSISGIMAAGILLGLIALAVWGLRNRKQLRKTERKVPWKVFAAMGGAVAGYFFIITVEREVWHMIIGQIPWGLLLGILVSACALFALWSSRKRIGAWLTELGDPDRWALLGKVVRIGIIVAAVIVGYCIFSVQVRGNFKSEYFAEQITVTHIRGQGIEVAQYRIDFVEDELVYFTMDHNGNPMRQWSKPLKEADLEKFMETCNEAELLGRSYVAAEKTMLDYCQIHTYSTLGERLVYDSSGHYLDGEKLAEELNQVFFDLTGVHCLTTR